MYVCTHSPTHTRAAHTHTRLCLQPFFLSPISPAFPLSTSHLFSLLTCLDSFASWLCPLQCLGLRELPPLGELLRLFILSSKVPSSSETVNHRGLAQSLLEDERICQHLNRPESGQSKTHCFKITFSEILKIMCVCSRVCVCMCVYDGGRREAGVHVKLGRKLFSCSFILIS